MTSGLGFLMNLLFNNGIIIHNNQRAHPGLRLAVEYGLIRSGKSQEECFAQYTALSIQLNWLGCEGFSS